MSHVCSRIDQLRKPESCATHPPSLYAIVASRNPHGERFLWVPSPDGAKEADAEAESLSSRLDKYLSLYETALTEGLLTIDSPKYWPTHSRSRTRIPTPTPW